MNKKSKIIIFSAVFIGIIILYFGLFHQSKKRFDWSEDFVLDKEKPFGTWLLSELLKEYDADRDFKQLNTPLDQSLKKAKIPSNYVFIGQEIYLEEHSADSVLSFVAKGNNAFIFTSSNPSILLNKILHEQSADSVYFPFESYYSDSLISYINDEEKSKEVGYFIPYSDRWTYFYHWNYLEISPAINGFKKLGSFEAFNEDGESRKGTNFYSIKFKKGTFYFHTQSVAFTNNVLKEKDMLAYTNRVFSHLNEGPILWEEHNWRFNQPSTKTWFFKPDYFKSGKSPLSFIFLNPSLKWAWYLLLVFIIVFVIFNGKRKMGIIPVLPARKNTSLEHIQLISELYQRENDHYAISTKVFGNFLSYLRNEMRINTKQDSAKIIDEILIKTNLEKKDVESIFNNWKSIENSRKVNTETFLLFNKEINRFLEKLKQ